MPFCLTSAGTRWPVSPGWIDPVCTDENAFRAVGYAEKTLLAGFSRDLRIAAIIAKPLEMVEFEESNKK